MSPLADIVTAGAAPVEVPLPKNEDVARGTCFHILVDVAFWRPVFPVGMFLAETVC